MAVVMIMMVIRDMNIKFNTLDAALVALCEMKVVPVNIELFQFVFELLRVYPQIDQRADKHVATDAAKKIQVEGFHRVTEKHHEWTRINTNEGKEIPTLPMQSSDLCLFVSIRGCVHS